MFVPRDSSEFLAEQAVRRLRKRKRPVHVDLATGAGTVALAVANEVPKAAVYGADVATDAVKLARKNAKRLGLQARFAAGDLFDALPKTLRGTVDVITLHPPYVARGEIDDLPDEIRDWEPVAHAHRPERRRAGLGPPHGRGGARLAPQERLAPDGDRPRPGAKTSRAVFRDGGFRDVESTKGGG